MDASEILFQYALAQLCASAVPDGTWTIGGGTILKQFYSHRNSKDIDIFVSNPQLLASFSPRVNDAVEGKLLDYQETSGYIKLIFPEGKVDFIVSGRISSREPHEGMLFGHVVLIDDPVEIVAKKIYYRCADFKPRDIFDLATVYSDKERQGILLEVAASMPDKTAILTTRINAIAASGEYEKYIKNGGIDILEQGKAILEKEISICQDFLTTLNNLRKY